MKQKGQFGAILKKDLKLVFTVKTLLVTVLVPFLMMFLIIGVPSIFIGTSNVTIYVYNQDQPSEQMHHCARQVTKC